ncbi:MAG: hypothetical protein ACR2QO_19955, partial [Acidimicrobiales bacterium]
MTAASAQAGLAEAREATPYQFGLPRRLSEEKLALYHEAARQIALDAENAISQWVQGCSVEADPVAEIDANTGLFGSSGPLGEESNHDVVPLTIAGVGCGTLATELELALAVVSGALGGSARAEIEIRPLTSIEVRVFDLIGTAVLNAACRTLL